MTPAVSEAEIVDYVSSNYALTGPLTALLIRQGFNDHYLIESSAGNRIFRVYHAAKLHVSSDAELKFELDLLAHLAGGGVPVAAPIATIDGALLTAVSDHRRAGALFEFAPGSVVKSLSPHQAMNLGEAVGRLHLRADTFSSAFSRYHLDIADLLDQPLKLAAEIAGAEAVRDDRPEFGYLREMVDSLGRGAGAFGIIHGDCQSTNVHFSGDAPTFFDFDHCAYGWRSYDLTSCFLSLQHSSDAAEILRSPCDTPWGAFLAGYASTRSPDPTELEAIPAFSCLRAIWDIGNVLAAVDRTDDQAMARLSKTVPKLLDRAAHQVAAIAKIA